MSATSVLLTNFTSGELSPRLAGRVDVSKYFNGCQELENFVVQPHGGVTRRGGMRYVADAARHAGRSLLVPYEDAGGVGWVLEFAQGDSGGVLRFFSGTGRVLGPAGAPLELATPYLAEHLDGLRTVQDRYSLVLVHPQFAPRKLTRQEDGGFALAEMAFTDRPEAWGEGNWPSLCCLHEDRLVFAATPQQPFTLWFSRTGDHDDFRLATREVPLDDWDDFTITDSNGDSLSDGRHGDTIWLMAGDGFTPGTAVAGYTSGGELCYYRYKGNHPVYASLSSGYSAGLTTNLWPNSGQLPAVRDADGALRTDYWEEFAVGQRIAADVGDAPLDDDAVEVTLSAQRGGRICFLAPRDRLWVGATSGEWTVSGSSLNTPVTPGGVKASREGTFGAAAVQPCQAGAALLYVQRSGRKVREMAYRLDSDAYTSRDLTLLSAHLGEPGMVQLAAVQEPDPMLYCVRADGVLLAMTYLPEQEVCAFSRLVTDGVVESACSVFDQESCRDVLWLVVRRSAVVNGAVVERRFIEVLEPCFSETASTAAGAFFLDSGLSYAGEPVSRLEGLGHLCGRQVEVLADGAVQPPQTVAPDGAISLARPARVVHAGLGYRSTLTPMRLESSDLGGTQSRSKRILGVSLRLHRSLGGQVGPDAGHLEPLLYRTSADAMDGPPALFTGDKTVRFRQGWSPDGVLTLVQDQPLPMTVLLLAPSVSINA